MKKLTNPELRINSFKRITFICIGSFIIFAVLAWCNSVRQFINRASLAKGVVTRLNAGGSHPQVRFTTQGAKMIEYPQNGLIHGYKVGDQVTVLYDAKNPRDAEINTFAALWGFPLLGIIVGAAFIGISILQKYRPDLIE